ncbi:hypothetical protein ILYODFUR_038433 [Ilyodon furcidens]|uniref:Uncharacterized protein n=1 Tax=Ilyodon furcidens TaxID=33524 RepID=A0ABV0V1L8_9TELE
MRAGVRRAGSVPLSRRFRLCSAPYLPLDLPHVDEVLPQLGAQQELPSQDGEAPGRRVPSPVGQQAGAAVQVENGAVPELRARITADHHLQRSRHVGLTMEEEAEAPPTAAALY